MEGAWQLATDPPGVLGRLPVRTSCVDPNVAARPKRADETLDGLTEWRIVIDRGHGWGCLSHDSVSPCIRRVN
jgi:hypothetical protein